MSFLRKLLGGEEEHSFCMITLDDEEMMQLEDGETISVPSVVGSINIRRE